MQLPAFMELRVHEPEEFWTKMALCGATTLQLGIEAIAGALLRSMKKGTRVVQNLAATKYMSEMGIRDASNLIIHHPRSSVEDVAETIRIMKLCEHLPIFNLSRFVVSYGSPLYNDLDRERKGALSRGFDWLPLEMTEYGWPRHLSYTWPNAWTAPAVTEAWLRFQDWYHAHVQELSARDLAPTLEVHPDGLDNLLIRDTRFGADRAFALIGLDARVADACHQPKKVWNLRREIDAPETAICEALARLEDQKVIVRVQDDYLTLALRPMRARIANCLNGVSDRYKGENSQENAMSTALE